LDLHNPVWLSNFNLFVTELKNNFRTFNPKGEAEAELEALHMHENHQAMKYFIKLQQLATQVQWGDAALQQQAYNGLAKDIKDDMDHHNKPNTLRPSETCSSYHCTILGMMQRSFLRNPHFQIFRKQV